MQRELPLASPVSLVSDGFHRAAMDWDIFEFLRASVVMQSLAHAASAAGSIFADDTRCMLRRYHIMAAWLAGYRRCLARLPPIFRFRYHDVDTKRLIISWRGHAHSVIALAPHAIRIRSLWGRAHAGCHQPRHESFASLRCIVSKMMRFPLFAIFKIIPISKMQPGIGPPPSRWLLTIAFYSTYLLYICSSFSPHTGR